MTPELDERLRRLAEQPECATTAVDYPLWLMEQTMDLLLDLLRGSAILLTAELGLCLARWTFGAALVSRGLVERITAAQARRAVLAPVIHGLLLLAEELTRVPPPPFAWGPRERAVLAEYARSGRWWMQESEPVREAVYQEALFRLPVADALLVGLVPTASGVNEALRLLDLDEDAARAALGGACERLDGMVRQVVAEHLRGGTDFSAN